MTDPFLPFGAADPNAEVTLFCLPHAGTGASCYRGWTRGVLPPWVDVRPVQLPGREGLWREALVDDAVALAAHLAARLRGALDRPFVIYGHSMGGLLAAELTAALARAGQPLPRLLVVSGYSRASRAEQRPSLDNDSLVEWLRDLGGTDPAVLADPEMQSLVLPVLRTDLTLAGAYRPTWTTLPVPILALGGTMDRVADAQSMADWPGRSDVGADVVMLDGDHFFNQQRYAEVCARIVDQLLLEGAR